MKYWTTFYILVALAAFGVISLSEIITEVYLPHSIKAGVTIALAIVAIVIMDDSHDK